MVPVPAGTFTMGSLNGYPDERPVHRVHLEGFYIDKFEVTNEEYVQFIRTADSGCAGHVCVDTQADNSHSHIVFREGRLGVEPGYEQHPVTNVSWYGAQAYCRYEGKRLPSEAEWEKAARGADCRAYPWGNSVDRTNLNADYRAGGASPVGSYPGGTSPYGLYDVAGNVWEWTSDWYQAYPGSSHRSSSFGEKYKVVRGGSWNHPDRDARTTHRDFAHPDRRIHVVGFRCAQSP
jgi:formylglycine-generating enzyme required for sulfatase activity